jgi:NADPH:quinone reductase-like Zn-dependent oxidoreductase
MKAIQLGEGGSPNASGVWPLDRLRCVQLPDPTPPKAGEIAVRIHASSLNYHDYTVVRSAPAKRAGLILMSDGAGVVEAVGEGVHEFSRGDHVVSCFFPLWQDGPAPRADFSNVPGDGVDGYARERVVRPASWFTRAPKGYSHAEAATLTTAGLTAWRALICEGALKAGDSVLILGTGGVAIFALQLAKRMGAHVIVTSSSDEKLERARALGADQLINYQRDPKWEEAVRRASDGRGVDQVLELGGPATLPRSIAATRIGGLISLIGTVTGYAGELPTALLMARQVRLHGLIVGHRRQQQEFVRALEVNELHPVIDRSFPLEGLTEAFRHQESARHLGKICLEL